jgi:PleD family two-component response regulator
MKANLQSSSSGHIVDDITGLRQRLEYFERHLQNESQEVRNEYNQALSKVLEAEKSIHHFAEVFNDR